MLFWCFGRNFLVLWGLMHPLWSINLQLSALVPLFSVKEKMKIIIMSPSIPVFFFGG